MDLLEWFLLSAAVFYGIVATIAFVVVLVVLLRFLPFSF